MHSIEAVAAFIAGGGQVVRLQETVPVTAPEIMEYLAAHGIKAKYSTRHPRLFLCKGKLISLTQLVALANHHRRGRQLPLFVPAVRI